MCTDPPYGVFFFGRRHTDDYWRWIVPQTPLINWIMLRVYRIDNYDDLILPGHRWLAQIVLGASGEHSKKYFWARCTFKTDDKKNVHIVNLEISPPLNPAFGPTDMRDFWLTCATVCPSCEQTYHLRIENTPDLKRSRRVDGPSIF